MPLFLLGGPQDAAVTTLGICVTLYPVNQHGSFLTPQLSLENDVIEVKNLSTEIKYLKAVFWDQAMVSLELQVKGILQKPARSKVEKKVVINSHAELCVYDEYSLVRNKQGSLLNTFICSIMPQEEEDDEVRHRSFISEVAPSNDTHCSRSDYVDRRTPIKDLQNLLSDKAHSSSNVQNTSRRDSNQDMDKTDATFLVGRAPRCSSDYSHNYLGPRTPIKDSQNLLSDKVRSRSNVQNTFKRVSN